MPCYDDRDRDNRYTKDQQLADAQSKIHFLATALGAVWDAMQDHTDLNDHDVLNLIDFKEVRISRDELRNWRVRYVFEKQLLLKAEEAKKEAKKREKEMGKIRAQAFEKLSPQELEALGFPAPKGIK